MVKLSQGEYNRYFLIFGGKSMETKKARLDLVNATAIVLKNGLELLNIEALEKM